MLAQDTAKSGLHHRSTQDAQIRVSGAIDESPVAIYGSYMQKTTVYLDEESYRRLKRIAHQSGQAPAQMIRQAVAEYTARHAPRRKPSCVGAFRSGRRDLGKRAEELLAGFGEQR